MIGSRGIDLLAAGAAFLIGAMLSLPWLGLLLLVIWRAGRWLDAHVLVFTIAGPPIVCASWYLLVGWEMLDVVATTTAVSSGAILIYRALRLVWPKLVGTQADSEVVTGKPIP
ncbi:hypothetical protein [Novosphingobium sp. 9]|uniref:hypothetical protein n=1 Tax=Novosphingobium sp. 9 TaxID=2025349 RepID=UPI0021B5D5D8|nr:hypothetical protein [Novosphingobium sp. 9]